jgi:UDP-N-acetylglucosamine--N-acetylmuramyl-(pentapeptide) pyrophosphoryl-undecaprenol N-acetylglucosamine transferase
LKKQRENIRVIISGGGTGGHIFPAISIADEIRRRNPMADILFVGAKNRMEMEKVPAAGYKIIGLPVSGFQRKLTMKNLLVIWNLMKSIIKAAKIVRNYKPDIAIGVGGYVSGPVIRSAAYRGIPSVIQEQNSYAGVTNKILARKVNTICVAYSNMERYFPKNKIVVTGNPVRVIKISEKLKDEGLKFFNLTSQKKVLLVVGGSLGARTINDAVLNEVPKLLESNIELIWQTGSIYFEKVKDTLSHYDHKNIHIYDFISRMDLAYNVADLTVSRAGAISISEICLTGRASILVPSPNVAEDHQTRNAMALAEANAAILIKDSDARRMLVNRALELIYDQKTCTSLSQNSLFLAKPEATSRIVDEIFKLIEK